MQEVRWGRTPVQGTEEALSSARDSLEGGQSLDLSLGVLDAPVMCPESTPECHISPDG